MQLTIIFKKIENVKLSKNVKFGFLKWIPCVDLVQFSCK